jgi:transcriptional regulator with XRE-family HTH domain
VYAPKHVGVKTTPQKRFGKRIKELRAVNQVTQEELAERAGLFRTYMSRVETGAANPTLTVIHDLATALKVPVGSLFEGPSAEPPPKTRSTAKTSRGRVTKG